MEFSDSLGLTVCENLRTVQWSPEKKPAWYPLKDRILVRVNIPVEGSFIRISLTQYHLTLRNNAITNSDLETSLLMKDRNSAFDSHNRAEQNSRKFMMQIIANVCAFTEKFSSHFQRPLIENSLNTRCPADRMLLLGKNHVIQKEVSEIRDWLQMCIQTIQLPQTIVHPLEILHFSYRFRRIARVVFQFNLWLLPLQAHFLPFIFICDERICDCEWYNRINHPFTDSSTAIIGRCVQSKLPSDWEQNQSVGHSGEALLSHLLGNTAVEQLFLRYSSDGILVTQFKIFRFFRVKC
jgi:hypothetical protein